MMRRDKKLGEQYGRQRGARGKAELPRAMDALEELYCIVFYLPPVLNPMSYDGARVYALGRKLKCKGW